MDDREDIFGKDIKDSSHLQLVSSDEEDLGSQRSHESPKAKADFKASSPTKKDNYCEEKFDRQLRLDKSLESNIGADTQNIIDEINKIFEKSETHEEPEATKSPNLLEKSKQMIADLTRRLASVPENLLTPKTGRPEPPTETKRTRSTRKRSYRFDSDLEDLSGFSSPSDPAVLTDDDDYEPSKGPGSKRKTPKKKARKGGRKPKRPKAERNEPVSEEEHTFGDSKSFDNFGFDRAAPPPAPPADDFLNLKDDSGDMICLKFAVVDQNRNVINDSRLDSVFIKTSETLGNIAKKIGELYHLGAEYHPRIRVIIDGETQDHDLQIGKRGPSPGSPELGVEERMQIDIKFPPKDEVILKNGYHPKAKGRNRILPNLGQKAMEHVQVLRKVAATLEGLRADCPEALEEADELFEALAFLKDSYKISFDLESFANTPTSDLDNAKLDWALGDDPESNPRVKKTVKRLFNALLAHLLRSLESERSFEPALERLLQLMEFEHSMGAEPKGARALEFLDLVLIALFLGNFYGLGVVQHLLLHGSYASLLPQSISSLVKNPDRAAKVNEVMNGGDPRAMEPFNERLVIFVSKLPTPDGPRAARGQNNALNIAKKELALRNSAILLDTNSPEPEDAEASSSSDSDEESDDSEGSSEDEAVYATQYAKMWETLVDSLMYRADEDCLALILESLPRLGLPYLYNPLRVANFLYSSLSSGREDVVVNSLNCLLELILHYQLTDQVLLGALGHGGKRDGSGPDEFDWFYAKLYGLIDFRYLSSRSSPVLILMAERALSSPMLPTRLVSSFIKRLLEAAALADTSVCNCLLAISFRLLHKHHRNLLHMIHAPGAEGVKREAGEPEGQRDLFLHELYLLLHHFSLDTAKIAGVFFTDLRQKSNLTFDTRDFLQPPKLQKLVEKSQGTHQSPFRRVVQNSTSLASQLFGAH